MAKKQELTDKEKAALKKERQEHRRSFRRRLLGAFVVFSATFLLWEIGGVLPPPAVLHDVPPIDEVRPPAALESFAPAEEEAEGQAPAEPIQAIAPAAEEEETFAPAEEEEALAPAAENEAAAPESFVQEILAEAEALAGDAEAPGGDAEETAPAPAAAEETQQTDLAAAAAPSPPPVTLYAVQIGAYGKQQSADNLAGELRKSGLSVRVQPIQRDDAALWRVRVVAFDTRAEARRQQQALEKQGYKDTRIVALPAGGGDE